MRKGYDRAALAGLVLAAGILGAALTAAVLGHYYSSAGFRALERFSEEIIQCHPETEPDMIRIWKEYGPGTESAPELSRLRAYGYGPFDLFRPALSRGRLLAVLGALTGSSLILLVLFLQRKKTAARMEELTAYVGSVNRGEQGGLLPEKEDECSGLQDEICKTVTELWKTRDTAQKDRDRMAENLANIAHQIRTPITAIHLTVQMMETQHRTEYTGQIRRQLLRLTHLEEALLLLSRIDAGTLALDRSETDVFTLLMLAADHLQELFQEAGVSIEIPEAGALSIHVDQDWTMEAFMNLMKNCMEHTPPGGTVRCRYEQNPLYTRIRIWDPGSGFAREDLPHLFDRFYRGRDVREGGIGIGLSLSRAIIERQNGTIRAENLQEGGACFEVRFYREG